MIADLALGSNLGDRVANLQAAVDGLADAGCTILAVSAIYATDPVGGPDQGEYLNAVVRVDTALEPPALLALAQRIEHSAGRVRDERWGPRTLDVDVLRYEGVTSDDPVLTLPHPRMWERAFVLVPLADVDPSIQLTIDTSGVRRTDGSLIVGAAGRG